MLVGQRGAARRDGVRRAGQHERHDVGVALADHHLAARHDLPLRPVEPVEQAALLVEGRVGRVLVLRHLVAERATPEPGRLTPGVVDGEHEPRPELVLELVDAVDEREAGLLDVLALEPFTLEVDAQRVVPVRCPTEMEAAGGVTIEVPGPEVLAPGSALRCLDEQAVVERDRGADDLAETLLALAVLADGDVVVAERDAGARRQSFDGLDEVEMLDLPDERDRVAALLATEAVAREDVVFEREVVSLRYDRAEDLLHSIAGLHCLDDPAAVVTHLLAPGEPQAVL